MAELFQAVFCGELHEGTDPEEVKRQLEELGVLRGAEAREAFAGKPVVLREGLTREQAERFAGALETAQVHCRVLPESWLVCPECELPQAEAQECVKCGLIFAKHHLRDLPPLRTREEIVRDLNDAGYKKFSDQETAAKQER